MINFFKIKSAQFFKILFILKIKNFIAHKNSLNYYICLHIIINICTFIPFYSVGNDVIFAIVVAFDWFW